MRLSLSTVRRSDWPAAVRAGLPHSRAFELACPDPALPASPADLRNLARLKSTHGLSYSLHAPFRRLDVAAADRALRRESCRLYHAALEVAATLGAELVVMHPALVGTLAWQALPEGERRALRSRELESFHHFAERAGRLRVRIGLENMPGFRAARDTRWLRAVHDAVDSPWLGYTVDVGHAHSSGIPAALLVRELGPRVWHVHVHDNSGQGDEHRAVGEGSVDWVSLVRALAETGFAGLVTDEALGLDAQLRGRRRLGRILAGLPRPLGQIPSPAEKRAE
ncbi:MAG: sugar phosphate isomerase/epimerase [Candidatus Eisenbacteria bacterium]|nr:sugar phosphate isomerase/epimerase [Candidatus Eisenbacteria bacterium]